jgi:folate-binding Fe-S cluster repair protein YgfZ
MESVGFCWLPERRIIELAGADKDDFLQAIISQDVTNVTQTQSLWAALLSP